MLRVPWQMDVQLVLSLSGFRSVEEQRSGGPGRRGSMRVDSYEKMEEIWLRKERRSAMRRRQATGG